MDDWGDISASALTYTEPAAQDAYQPVMSGPKPAGDPAAPPNQASGDITMPRGASILLSGGGAVRNNGRASDFEISEDVGFMAKGVGIALASLITSAYESAPIQWFSEGSFEEVAVTAPYSPPSKTQFYADAFKQDVTGDLTVSDVDDLGDSWKITFTGATLTADGQVGNLIEPDWAAPWYKYLSIVSNGADWVEVLKGDLATAPVATDTFSIHGVYANSIRTWQQPYGLLFTTGGNEGSFGLLATGGSVVNRTTGLVTLAAALANNIVAGDRLKSYDERVIFKFGWNNLWQLLCPSSRAPDDLHLYLGGESTVAGTKAWKDIFMRAKEGIYASPGETHDQTFYIQSRLAALRAHLEVTLGNFRVRDGELIIKDGITAPAAESGFMKFYVDVADGDLKVIFGDGTIKTLTVDT